MKRENTNINKLEKMRGAAPRLKRLLCRYLEAEELEKFPFWNADELAGATVYIQLDITEDLAKPYSRLRRLVKKQTCFSKGEEASLSLPLQILMLYQQYLLYQEYFKGKI